MWWQWTVVAFVLGVWLGLVWAGMAGNQRRKHGEKAINLD